MLVRRLTQNAYGRALIAGGAIIALPLTLVALSALIGSIDPDPCMHGVCERKITQVALDVGFYAFFLLPLAALIALVIWIVTGAAFGIAGFRRARASVHRGHSAARVIVGGISILVILFWVYVPKGPEPCSRSLTDTRYEVCLERLFSGMTLDEVQVWLIENGYSLSGTIRPTAEGFAARDARHEADPDFAYDAYFEAWRDNGYGRSIPYGTNFNRMFARIPPAPGYFNLWFYARDDRIVAVDVLWAFSFL